MEEYHLGNQIQLQTEALRRTMKANDKKKMKLSQCNLEGL
jgi:hypothetical protein